MVERGKVFAEIFWAYDDRGRAKTGEIMKDVHRGAIEGDVYFVGICFVIHDEVRT